MKTREAAKSRRQSRGGEVEAFARTAGQKSQKGQGQKSKACAGSLLQKQKALSRSRSLLSPKTPPPNIFFVQKNGQIKDHEERPWVRLKRSSCGPP